MAIPRRPLHIDPDSWLAGVMDGGARLDLWESGRGRWNWRMTITMDERTAAMFERLSSVKLRRIGVARYTVVPTDALPLLARVMPRMISLHEEAGVIYRYLLTRAGRTGMRGAMTTAVGRYRKEMVERLRVSREATK